MNFLFVLIQKETKKPRKNEASARMPNPGPAIFPGRRAWVANSSDIFLVYSLHLRELLNVHLYNFLFVLTQKETKKSRLPNVIKQKLRYKKPAQPKPFLC
jgi:hypothetical protein